MYMYGLVNYLRSLLDTKIERYRVRRRSEYAGAIEQQIREQLQQQHESTQRNQFQFGYEAGRAAARETYHAECDLLHATVAIQEAKIRELQDSQGITKVNKGTRAKRKTNTSKR
jgi:hypothetical protein